MGLYRVFLLFHLTYVFINTGMNFYCKIYGLDVQSQTPWPVYGVQASATCPCEICASVTLCRNMGHSIVPVGIPTNQLTRLLLSGNQIVTLHGNTFRDMNTLKSLYLEYNNISTIDKNAFSGLYSLEALQLDNNQLEYIHKGTFRGLKNLTKLFLNDNRLATFPGDIPYLRKLERLTIDNNRIRRIPWTSFTRLKQLRLAKLWNNRMSCDCNTNELLRWFTRPTGGRGIKTGRKLECTQEGAVSCTTPTVTDIRFRANNSGVHRLGDDAVVYCDVEGDPHPLVSWRTPVVGFVFPYQEDRVTVYTNGTLVVKNLTRSDSGTYVCYAQLSSTTTRSQRPTTIRIINAIPPMVSVQNSNVKVNVGGRAEMTCQVLSGDPLPEITWFAPGHVTPHGPDNFTDQSHVLSNSGATLAVVESKQHDNGWWRCVATNVQGTSEGRIRLTVNTESKNNTMIIIIAAAAAAVVLLIIVSVTAAICIRRRRKKRKKEKSKIDNNIQEPAEEKNPPEEIIEEEEDQAYEPKFLPGSEQLQQPYEYEPEVRGFRL
nr:peroxidasin-like protein [Ciona intestinalis]|eukprot:XP_002122982.1 peroxidasin-like protein [Ciona intestinalis]